MKKPTLYISCGVPGAGKTTFLKENKAEDEVIISRDEIRYSFLKEEDAYFKHERLVYSVFVYEIGTALKQGKNVYADATHLNGHSRSKLIGKLKNNFPNLEFDTEFIFFDVPTYICLERNNQRTGRARVPKDAVLNMARVLERPNKKDYGKHLWVVDKDGVLYKEW